MIEALNFIQQNAKATSPPEKYCIERGFNINRRAILSNNEKPNDTERAYMKKTAE